MLTDQYLNREVKNMMSEVYVIISNFESRFKIQSICSTKEKVVEVYQLLDSGKPDCIIRESVGPFNTKYYSLDSDGNKLFKEQLYVEKRPVLA